MQTVSGRKIQFSVSIPYDLYEKICAECWDERRSKAFVVTKALKVYYSQKPAKFVEQEE